MSTLSEILIAGSTSSTKQMNEICSSICELYPDLGKPSVIGFSGEPVVRLIAMKTIEHISSQRRTPSALIVVMPPITNYLLDSNNYALWDNHGLQFVLPDENGGASNKRAVITDHINRKYDISIEMAAFYSYVALDVLDNMMSCSGVKFLFTFDDENSSIATSKLQRLPSFTPYHSIVERLGYDNNMGN